MIKGITAAEAVRRFAEQRDETYFDEMPTFEQFHVQCLCSEPDARLLYKTIGDDVELLNTICWLSQEGCDFNALRYYAVYGMKPKP